MSPRTLRHRIDRTVVRWAGQLPGRLQYLLSGSAPITIDGQVLHPELQLALKLIALSGDLSVEQLPVEKGRAQLSAKADLFGGPPIPVADVRNLVLPGPAGDIRARLYAPTGVEEPPSLLVYYHGGGWVVGDLDTHDNNCRFLANQACVKVLSIDYRLAPEHKFPAAPDDAYAAFRYAAGHAEQLGVDPAAIAVGGDSAGANLAAVVCQLARADGGTQPAFQLLLVPGTDLSTKRRSCELFSDGFVLTEAQLDWYVEQYLPSPEDAFDPKASPMLAPDLAGLPPAYIATGGFDPLRDDGEEYAARLLQAGVPVAYRLHDDLIHPFANTTGYGRTGTAALLEAAGALRTGLAIARQSPTARRRGARVTTLDPKIRRSSGRSFPINLLGDL